MSEKIDELKNKTIKGFFWRFNERVASQVVGLIVSVVLARLLEPSEYGIIALTMIFMSVANVLSVSGLGASLIQKKDADDLDFSTMFYAGLGLSIIMYIILFIASPFIAYACNNGQVESVLCVLGLMLPISAINSIQQAYVSRELNFKKFFYATLVGTVSSGIIGIAMAYYGYGVWALVGQMLSSNIINTFVLNRIIKWHPTRSFSIQRFKELYKFGLNFMGANLMGTLFNELKSFVIGVKYLPADLAFYKRGEQLPAIISDNINNTINTVIFPAISKIQDNKQDVKHAIRRSMMTSSYVMTPLLFFMAASADNITLLLLTEKWMPCVPYMRVICISYCVSILGTANLQAFNAVGRSDITFKLEFIKKPLYLIMIFLTMWISPLAIAIGNLIYGVIATSINAWPNKKLIDYKIIEQLKDVYPQFIISAVIGLVVFIVGFISLSPYLMLLIQILIGLGLYILLSIMFSLESYKYVLNTIKNFTQCL